MNIGRTIRTIVHLQPVQIWNRVWRKRLSFLHLPQPPSSTSPLGDFEFLNVKENPRGWNDPRLEKLWLYNLHYFDYLNNEVDVEGRGEQWKLDIVLRWIRENPKGWGNGWEPYPISLRVVNWIKWLKDVGRGDGSRDGSHKEHREHRESGSLWSLCSLWLKRGGMVGHKEHREHKEEGEKGFEERIKESLREQVEWLYPRLEYHLLANHLLANAKALVFAGTYFLTQSRGGAEEEKLGRRWLEKGLEIYRKELPEQVLADGVHFERSPMYHSIILEDLLDCFELLRLRPEVERRMGWGWISHREHKEHRGMGEGMLRSEVEEDARLFKEYAGKMLSGLKILTGPDGKIAKFNDATEGIAKTPEELFAFAESLGIHSQPQPSTSTSASGFVRQEAGAWTLLAKCGEIGPSYQPGHAHADTWSFELWKDGRKVIGDTGCSTYVPGPVRSYERSTAAHNTVVIDGENSSEVWAAHRVGRRFDFGRHRRRFELTAEGLKGVDEVFGSGEHELEVRFHLPPGVEEKDVKIACDGERRVEPCEFAAGWNRREAGRCVVYHQTVRLPAMFTWSVS